MSIDITFFNVGHGDSILIEKKDTDRVKAIIIDCNLDYRDKSKVPIYEYLKSHNIKIIDGIIITHMHKDHISGFHKILTDKDFTIKKMIIPPIFSLRTNAYDEIFQRWEKATVEDAKHIDPSDKELSAEIGSRATIFSFIKNNKGKVEEKNGGEERLRFQDITDKDVEFWVYLPLLKTKSNIERILNEKDYSPTMCHNLNDFSLAVGLKYGENAVLLTGDSTGVQWREHKRMMKSNGLTNLGNNMLKAPHHGAKADNDLNLYNYYFDNSTDKEKYVFISAAGFNKKPHSRVLNFISDNGMKIRCTNISRSCLGDVYNSNGALDALSPHLRSFIGNYDLETVPTPCIGDIHVTIDKTSQPIIVGSTNHSCLYDLNTTSYKMPIQKTHDNTRPQDDVGIIN